MTEVEAWLCHMTTTGRPAGKVELIARGDPGIIGGHVGTVAAMLPAELHQAVVIYRGARIVRVLD